MMRIARTLHKWIGLIAGVQLCLWLVSGLVMSLLDHHVVSGDSTAAPAATAPSLDADSRLVEPAALLARHAGETVRAITLGRQLERWTWRVESNDGVALYDAASGAPVHLDEARARAIAAAGRAGDLTPRRATLIEAPTLELRDHEGAAWRVAFDDPQQTRYYIAADDGRILARRTGDWRVFDFFWMLHTMDYWGRDDFNNPLAVTFAFLTVWIALTGALLLVKSLRKQKLTQRSQSQ